MKYVSIDVETTGLDPNTSQLLEVGLVVADSTVPFVQNNHNSLRIVFLREELKGNIVALNMNRNLLTEMSQQIAKLKELNQNNSENFGLFEKTDLLTTRYYSLELFKEFGQSIEEYLTLTIKKFFINNGLDTGKITVAGKNFAMFDKLFLEQYEAFKTMILGRMRHRVLDVGSMFVESTDKCIPDLKTCLKRAGFDSEVPHTAVEDAILVVKCAQSKFLMKHEN